MEILSFSLLSHRLTPFEVTPEGLAAETVAFPVAIEIVAGIGAATAPIVAEIGAATAPIVAGIVAVTAPDGINVIPPPGAGRKEY